MDRHRAMARRGIPPSSQTVGVGQALRQAFSPAGYPDEWAMLLRKLENS